MLSIQNKNFFQNKSFEINDTGNTREEEITIDGLEAYTVYAITITCKSSLGGYWSDPQTVTSRTLPSGV